ncbi:MAG TPA: PHP domain-containing protein [Ktedonobacteraceae bacterium]|jgi:histidinol-phosphatase (PHP family)
MPVDTDFHSHISRSSAQAMAHMAQTRGLRVLGLSEHIFQMDNAREPLTHMPLEGPLLSLSRYQEEVHRAAQEAQIDIRQGLEVDFIPEKHEHILAPLPGYDWDFLIGSVHQIDGVLFESKEKFTREEGQHFWQRYFTLLREAVKSKAFSLVSHPVRMRATNPHVPANIDEELEQLAAEATRQDVALEINGFDLLTYPTLVRRLARACALHNTPISVGSDAHNPAQIARAHVQSETLLRESGIRTIRIWKQRHPQEYIF